VDGAGSGLGLMVGFGISNAKTSHLATIVLITWFP
jgi:hypothetical protein